MVGQKESQLIFEMSSGGVTDSLSEEKWSKDTELKTIKSQSSSSSGINVCLQKLLCDSEMVCVLG